MGAALVAVGACSAERIDPMREGGASDAAVDAEAPVEETSTGEETSMELDASDDALEGPEVLEPREGGLACAADRDGVLQRSEVPYVLGATVLFAVNRDGTVVDGVQTAATMGPDGLRWDFSRALASDTRVLDEVQSPSGRWWASRYPSASFALPLDRASSLFGVYRATDTALQLLATVSRESNRTELAMDPPVDVMRFPMRMGDRWDQTVTARGVLDFVAHVNVTRYAFNVDAQGTVLTPAGRFAALRLRTELDQSIPLTVFRRTQRTYVYLSECWGLVARVTSTDNESAQEFTRASEYRRLGL